MLQPHSLRCKIQNSRKQTHLCCKIVKQIIVWCSQFKPEEVTMSAVAEVSSKPRSTPRGSDRPVCQVCADTMVVAEASAFLSDNVVSHLWSCETCGYGFVTKHSLKSRNELSAA